MCMAQAEIAAVEAAAEKEREKERIRSGAMTYRIATRLMNDSLENVGIAGNPPVCACVCVCVP